MIPVQNRNIEHLPWHASP